jgi:hypothetical protein
LSTVVASLTTQASIGTWKAFLQLAVKVCSYIALNAGNSFQSADTI